MANQSTLSNVRECSPNEAVLTFASGVHVVEMTSNISDPAASWKLAAQQNGAQYGEVDGQPAMIIAPDDQGSVGSISFVLGNTLVIVGGSGSETVSELEAVANSVKPAT
jgi:hypothetical protein